ncbi:MAG TPA: DUF4410 domain-containing protein [Gemmatimonadota bacterium]|nr:DUF4410 domain-containing protein [Gemmatimonadota bacterium]
MKSLVKRPWLILSAALVVSSACASHRYSVHEPVAKKFGAFDTVEVLPFTSAVDTESGRKVADELPDALVEVLADATRKGSKDRMFSVVTRSADQTQGVLTISGRILSFEEGSRAQRYLIGLGAGKALATVECVFTDKASGRQIAIASFDGELSGGLFGGSSSGAAEGVTKAVRDFLKDNY